MVKSKRKRTNQCGFLIIIVFFVIVVVAVEYTVLLNFCVLTLKFV